MIDIVDKKYGRIIIYEITDAYRIGSQYFFGKDSQYLLEKANLVGMRNLKNGEVTILKNRDGSMTDSKIKNFILNYGVILDPYIADSRY